MLRRERDRSFLQTRTRKAKKKVKKLKASTAQMRDEVTELTNLVENRYQAIVQIREAIHALTLTAESSNAQLLELISAWLDENHGD